MGRNKALRLLFWQAVWCWFLLVLSFSSDLFAVRTCFLTLFVVMIPQTVFVAICFKRAGSVYAKKIVNLFYIAELAKILLTGFLFLIVFYGYKVSINWFLGSYIGATLAYFWVPLLLERDI